ncbi:MAG: family 43 glycosylhydrolase, partial [Thermoguttaceae bacterium]|nr:family 43 glycosylhydrolase [Thermoguttaceae bacterium]
CGAEPVAYRNPIAALSVGTDKAWDDYGFGDPFVMRFNGRYYLYPSTRDDSIGVKCWSSRDLVSWNYEGLCSEDPTTKGAYAPEIYRGSDAFYMTTSPAGKGHYIYRSESPTGPFERVSDNFGLSIDGSVFVDDDGRGYFFSASDRGILEYAMDSETRVDPRPIHNFPSMNGAWTEGPTMFKHDGVYYMTYTGNHVFSRGYRIDASSGPDRADQRPSTNNPVLISTEGALFGIGHNSVVKGPNLDLYYIVYHSLIGRGTIRGWPVRETNIDRLVLNGPDIDVVGPTRAPQSVPQADAASWFDSDDDLTRLRIFPENAQRPTIVDGALRLGEGSVALLNCSLPGDFTAEFNLAFASDEGVAGAVFCRSDENNYGALEIDASANLARTSFVVDGKKTIRSYAIPGAFGKRLSFNNFRSFQVERSGDRFTFYVDDRKIAEETSSIASGSVGYFSKNGDVRFGFIGATRWTQGRSASELVEPVPGTIYASYRADFDAAFSERRLMKIEPGRSLDAPIDVAVSGRYDVALYYESRNDSVAELTVGTNRVDVELSGGGSASIVRELELSAGENRLSLIGVKGAFELDRLEIAASKEDPAFDDFANLIDKPSYSDGDWRVDVGVLSLVAKGKERPYGKRLYGENGWGDCRVEATGGFTDKALLVRASEPALGGPNNSPRLGRDFFFGYAVSIDADSVVLTKYRYAEQIVEKARLNAPPGDVVSLCVEAVGNRIVVCVDGEKTIDYVDPAPFLSGRVGFKGSGVNDAILDLRVTPLQ